MPGKTRSSRLRKNKTRRARRGGGPDKCPADRNGGPHEWKPLREGVSLICIKCRATKPYTAPPPR